jgi:hypothetical protein
VRVVYIVLLVMQHVVVYEVSHVGVDR